ncbi:Os03g0347750, partial [Oryza sativa Japonica Group]
GVAAAALEEDLGVGGGLGAELLEARLGGGAPEVEERAESPREAAEEAVRRADAHQLPPHAHLVLLQVRQPHPHPRHLQLQLPVLPPHRRVAVPRRHRPATHPAPRPRRRGGGGAPEEERRVVRAADAGVSGCGGGAGGLDRAAEAELLEVEHLHGHLHGEALVLRRVAARVRGQALAVDRLAHPVPLRFLDVRVHL